MVLEPNVLRLNKCIDEIVRDCWRSREYILVFWKRFLAGSSSHRNISTVWTTDIVCAKIFAARVSWFSCLGRDMQHHLVTSQSLWLPTNALQTEAMCLLACLWITAPRCLRLYSAFLLFLRHLLPVSHISHSDCQFRSSPLYFKQTLLFGSFPWSPLLGSFSLWCFSSRTTLSFCVFSFSLSPRPCSQDDESGWWATTRFQCLMNEAKQMPTNHSS